MLTWPPEDNPWPARPSRRAERGHRPDGLPAASGPVAARDPRPGRRHAAGRHRDLPGADPGRPQREQAAPRSRSGTASAAGRPAWTRCWATRGVDVYFDAQVTSAREAEPGQGDRGAASTSTPRSPWPASLDGALRLARAAREAGITHGVVQDKLFLPGMIKLRRLIRSASSAACSPPGWSSATGCSRAT